MQSEGQVQLHWFQTTTKKSQHDHCTPYIGRNRLWVFLKTDRISDRMREIATGRMNEKEKKNLKQPSSWFITDN